MASRFLRTDDGHVSDSENLMPAVPRRAVALYVDRVTQQWVVRDPDGDFWRLPSADNSWQHRQPFELTDEADLEIIPGHYRYMLDLPF